MMVLILDLDSAFVLIFVLIWTVAMDQQDACDQRQSCGGDHEYLSAAVCDISAVVNQRVDAPALDSVAIVVVVAASAAVFGLIYIEPAQVGSVLLDRREGIIVVLV
jgi:hypothetical protein